MCRKIFHLATDSLFVKIIILIFITWLFVNVGIGITYRIAFDPERHEFVRTNLRQYATYLIRELGMPPQKEKAEKLAKELSLRIRYHGADVSWATHENMPDIDVLYHRREHGPGKVGMYRGDFYLIANYNENQYLFMSHVGSPGNISIYFIILILFVSLVFTGIYFAFRKILKPVKLLNEGIAEVSRGNLAYNVEEISRDELGRLTRAFNDMRNRIVEMLKARDQLILDVSHELRSPLTRMKVALEFIDNEKIKISIHDDIHDLEVMTEEILEGERLDSLHGKLQLEKVLLSDLLHDIAGWFREIKPGIILDPFDDSIILNLDIQRFKLAVRNLIDNALKYSAEEGEAVHIIVDEHPDHIKILIHDHGSGIDKDDLTKLFEPFYRTDRSRSRETGGFGLGLSISKKIIEAHGGSLELTSEKGKGTTAEITLKVSTLG